jgi:hypothetical protein
VAFYRFDHLPGVTANSIVPMVISFCVRLALRTMSDDVVSVSRLDQLFHQEMTTLIVLTKISRFVAYRFAVLLSSTEMAIQQK